MEVLPFQSNYNADRLRVQVDEVAPLKLSEGIDSAGHVCTELEVLRQDLHLVHGEIGDEHHPVVLHPHYQTRVPLVSS